MENNPINNTAENQQGNTPPDANNAQRTFTQEEVNHIVSERLKREKTNNVDVSEYENRIQELEKKESAYLCKEHLKSMNLPESIAEYLDTSDLQKFKKTVGNLVFLFKTPSIPKTGTIPNNEEECIKKAFKPRI